MSAGTYEPVEFRAETVEQAINTGLQALGLKRNEVIIEILEEGARGLLGMGSKEAAVRIMPLRAPRPASELEAETPAPEPAPTEQPAEKSQPDQPAREKQQAPAPQQEAAKPATTQSTRSAPAVSDEEIEEELSIAQTALGQLLDYMGVDATVDVVKGTPADGEAPEDTPWILDVNGDDLGLLIGKRGETLSDLQYITRLIASRQTQRRSRFVVDVEGYKTRREDVLRKLAIRMADRAKEQGRTMTLEPMPPNERRIIHLTLRDDEEVITESVGDGDHRKVTIVPVRER